jgi:hypothetical protein
MARLREGAREAGQRSEAAAVELRTCEMARWQLEQQMKDLANAAERTLLEVRTMQHNFLYVATGTRSFSRSHIYF